VIPCLRAGPPLSGRPLALCFCWQSWRRATGDAHAACLELDIRTLARREGMGK
jgi:hypothetical protein